jgi:hypothetical protein
MSYDSDKIVEIKEDVETIEEKVDSLLELTLMIARKLGVGQHQ